MRKPTEPKAWRAIARIIAESPCGMTIGSCLYEYHALLGIPRGMAARMDVRLTKHVMIPGSRFDYDGPARSRRVLAALFLAHEAEDDGWIMADG